MQHASMSRYGRVFVSKSSTTSSASTHQYDLSKSSTFAVKENDFQSKKTIILPYSLENATTIAFCLQRGMQRKLSYTEKYVG